MALSIASGFMCCKNFQDQLNQSEDIDFEVGPKSEREPWHCFDSKLQFLVSRIRLHRSFSFWSHSDPPNVCFEETLSMLKYYIIIFCHFMNVFRLFHNGIFLKNVSSQKSIVKLKAKYKKYTGYPEIIVPRSCDYCG